ncbi:MAG: tryptophan--tRNA ligase [Rhodospirillales bacterium]|nr:tryptophan--tRNA ligase [Rhodospirillales bacterium]MBT4005568.1 tryptophan--tRNA ligase [Rhodospirillales bacterium]MBT5112287.1 tryptophan--tRNA ligase [Rhodospirillales bacterium]MBT5671988.1 tryptophan--tRNA ligase [Rhodospirillales bacterium]MBT6187254.1 tryptophan--tRNA ligase [Rhodospirillales bacterium]
MNRIFSGVQPTGNLHLGNYLGAIRNWVDLQHDYDCIFCIVDLHALTLPQDPGSLRTNTREVTAAYLAAGIDPEKCTIFNQSAVPGHSELAWLLGCVTPLGWLNRMTQFKEKAGKHRENAGLGLYSYPVLMAADILLYKATHVPVGEDQKQHLELCRDIAGAFNRQFGSDYFPLPEPQILGEATRVMSLRDGTAKMSKSDPSDNSRINMTDDADLIVQKIRKARTDPEPLPDSVEGLEGRAEAANLIGIYAALSGDARSDILNTFGGKLFSEFKGALSDLALDKLGPIGAEMQRLMKDPAYVDGVLRTGAERAKEISEKHMSEIHELIGVLRV